MLRKLTTAALILSLAVPSLAFAADWNIDPAHSRVGFGVRHMMVSTTKGEFKTFHGTASVDDDNPSKSRVSFEVEVASVDTDDAKRDEHLRSADFFDVAKFPKMTFQSTRMRKLGKGKYAVTGDLTLHGITKPVTVTVTLTDPVKTPWGFRVRGASVTGKIDRKDFGITWNKGLDGGGLVVGDSVALDIELELKEA